MMSPAARFARRSRRTLRRLGVAAFAWLVAVVLLAGVARAGGSFVYCHVMDSVRADCCCPHAQDDTQDTNGPAVGMGCCDQGTVPSLPTGATATPSEVPAVPLAMLLPPVGALSQAFALRASEVSPRTGRSASPPPPTAATSCARLSVFLI